MGNQLAQPSRLVATEAIADLGSVTFKDNLGERAAAPPGPASRLRLQVNQPCLLQAAGGSSRALCVFTTMAA